MRRELLVLFVFTLCLILVTPAYAAPKSSLSVRSTWDMDMIGCDAVSQTGKGIYVAVLDTGLTANWKDYFPNGNIMDKLGKGFKEEVKWDEETQTLVESGFVHDTSFIGDIESTHGTHVTSTIIGYNYYAPADAAAGYPLDSLFIRGVAPDVKIIPVKVLSDYHIGASHTDPVNYPEQHLVFGTDLAVAAGIDYATSLYQAGYKPMVITMSLGGPTGSKVIEDSIDRAIDAGVIVVAAAGNEGTDGMEYPGAYSQVISVGACGWIYEWFHPSLLAPDKANSRYRLWWLQDDTYGYNDIPEPTTAEQVYITEWSSRAINDEQELDVVAPGSWVRGPLPDGPGFSHLPWWSKGNNLKGNAGSNFYYVGGTSMATPHVTGVVALMLEKNPELTQSSVETTLESTALSINQGSAKVWDLSPVQGWHTYSWDTDATGYGLIQAKDALEVI